MMLHTLHPHAASIFYPGNGGTVNYPVRVDNFVFVVKYAAFKMGLIY
jgi:hypothetical protein